MAESGFFRVGFRGFKKEDVLQYIDEVQRTNFDRLTESEKLRLQAENEVSVQAQECAQAKERVSQLEAEAASAAEQLAGVQKLSDDREEQIERLTALAQLYKREMLESRERAQTAEAALKENEQRLSHFAQAEKELQELREALSKERQKNTSLQAELEAARAADKQKECDALAARVEKLKAENARYTALVGDVGQLIVEVRGLGKTLFEQSAKRSEECVAQAEATASALEREAAVMRAQVKDVREEMVRLQQSSDERLEALIDSFEGSADTTATDSSFFRNAADADRR